VSHSPGNPDIAIRSVVDPDSIGGKIFIEVVIVHLDGITFMFPLVCPLLSGWARWRWSLFSLIGNINYATGKK
jgi:hypothetical protein